VALSLVEKTSLALRIPASGEPEGRKIKGGGRRKRKLYFSKGQKWSIQNPKDQICEEEQRKSSKKTSSSSPKGIPTLYLVRIRQRVEPIEGCLKSMISKKI